MTRSRCTFRMTDLTRAIRAVEAAGKVVQRVEIEPSGKIVVLTGDGPAADKPEGANPWDNA